MPPAMFKLPGLHKKLQQGNSGLARQTGPKPKIVFLPGRQAGYSAGNSCINNQESIEVA